MAKSRNDLPRLAKSRLTSQNLEGGFDLPGTNDSGSGKPELIEIFK
jgi:hypothetical protein